MKRLVGVMVLGIATASCQMRQSAQPVSSAWQGRELYTCCNIHYEASRINDANYYLGALIPFGTPVQVHEEDDYSLTFRAGATDITLIHKYGKAQEGAQQYFEKILVPTDPRPVFATYPEDVQNAIRASRVEIGMTKPQVLMSLGYPPTHRTASIDLNTWTYWSTHSITYKVVFDDTGTVMQLIGNAPTSNQPIVEPTPTPKPAAARPARKGKK